MADVINRFRKLLYTQVALGVIAYAAARQSPTMLLLAAALIALSWCLVEGPRGRPLPDWSINLGVIAAALWMFYAQFVLQRPLIINLGLFILSVQILKLYQRKTNRDYAQLIVLSLVLITCASILSAAMIHAILLAAYLAVALLTVMYFQVKRGHDEVAEATASQTPPENAPEGPDAAPLPRAGRRRLRRLAFSCGLLGLVISALLFVVIPRRERTKALDDWGVAGRESVTRFDNQVRLAGNTRLIGSKRIVLEVRISRGGEEIGSRNRPFLLRGAALDTYDPDEQRWKRSREVSRADRKLRLTGGRTIPLLDSDDPRPPRPPLVQEYTLLSEDRGVLFSAYAPTRISSAGGLRSVHFNPRDQTLVAGHPLRGELEYTVESTAGPRSAPAPRSAWDRLRRFGRAALGRPTPARSGFDWDTYARRPVPGNDRIRRLTRSVIEKRGLTRDPAAQATPRDDEVAAAVERYLRSEFQYTLNPPTIPPGREPILSFLFDQRKGHCEYFASGMCAMLRSVGVRSRVVTGYRATEYNSVGGYYVVREKNAHAWVEAWSPGAGWRTYDPSPPADIKQIHDPERGMFAFFRDTYSYLQQQWIRKVISYDSGQRQSVMAGANGMAGGLAATAKAALRWVRDRLRTLPSRWRMGWGGSLFAGSIVLVILAAIAGLVKMLVHRRRSIRQLQLEALEGRNQRRLAEHLRFYLRMLRILRRAGHDKPTWQPPAGFARRLTRRNPDRFADVLPLTDLFYEIRFGGRPLDQERSDKIAQHLARLKEKMRRQPGENAARDRERT